ncbi:polysaccharide deacetylase family protein [Nesterenkonia flava]|uniref:Polysaccharide deacetylase family protein n=1 Tax=Nesterenkonia flava TaxID=469799 RepID=A0ABU1FSH6_9MICC|nr:polysaccharide deacetylase family protein [Nesterenkonia flava]MDR5711563.1 polysaccharide deacetylase family protein [Nesterenkonia flava]
MRHLPLMLRSLGALAALSLVLLVLPSPAPSASAASSPVWAQLVNERTAQVRDSLTSYPWEEELAAQAPNTGQTDEADPGDTHDDAGAEQDSDIPGTEEEPSTEDREGQDHEEEQMRHPDSEPETPREPSRQVFARNPGGPVDCSAVPCVALTFDDGPVPSTARVLDALGAVNARGTFFMTGQMAAHHPSIAARVAAERHEVANHGWSHTDFTTLSDAQLLGEISRTAETIAEVSGARPTLVRPPYGMTDSRVNALVGGPMIMWDVDSKDWSHRSASQTRQEVMRQVEPGSIVLLHDLQESTAEAVPHLVRDLLAEGYHLVTVSEILGHGTQAGHTYERGMRP